MIEQGSRAWLVGIGFKPPCAGGLPIAFHVHTVFGSTASEYRAMQRTRPHCDSTHIQPPSAMPLACAVREFTNRKLWLWIWRSHAFCESHEWYIAIGRCVMALSG